MIAAELAAAVQRRNEVIAEVVARVNDGEAVAGLGRVCESSGYCGCRCRNCLGGRHKCGHRKQCHVMCKSL